MNCGALYIWNERKQQQVKCSIVGILNESPNAFVTQWQCDYLNGYSIIVIIMENSQTSKQ